MPIPLSPEGDSPLGIIIMAPRHLTTQQYLNKEDAGYGSGYLSQFFTFEEMCESQYAIRNGIYNYPSDDQHIVNMENLTRVLLDPIRVMANSPIYISSGYRQPIVNKNVGGGDTSLHLFGMAADIKSYEFSVRELFQLILAIKYLRFHEIVFEYGSWIHVGLRGWKDGEHIKIIVRDKRVKKNLPIVKETFTRLQYDAGIVDDRLNELGYFAE